MFRLESKVQVPVQRAVFTYGRLDTSDRSQVISREASKLVVMCHNSVCNMMTSSNGNLFRVTGPLRGEFTGPCEFPTQRSVTRSFDVFFDLRLNKRLSKQP